MDGDLAQAGAASSDIKKKLRQLGVSSELIRRTAISMYEAEINMVIHAGGGVIDVEILPHDIIIVLEDHGPGIPDVELAMKEGYSTAPHSVREMGFGAGMGLANMKKNSDELLIDSVVGRGTIVTIRLRIREAAS
jgi:anti-sigma regulatory factor (Ser/Thr protein kinase)